MTVRQERNCITLAMVYILAAFSQHVSAGRKLLDGDYSEKTLLKHLNDVSDIPLLKDEYLNFYVPLKSTSERCINDSEVYLQGLNNFEPWALQMLDSSSKLPSGFMAAHVQDFGNFDECLHRDLTAPTVYPSSTVWWNFVESFQDLGCNMKMWLCIAAINFSVLMSTIYELTIERKYKDDNGFVRTFLSWKWFQPLGKLIFCIYFMHLCVQYITILTVRTSVYRDYRIWVKDIMGEFLFAVCLAVYLSCLIEAPFLNIEKLVYRKTSSVENESTQYDNKENSNLTDTVLS